MTITPKQAEYLLYSNEELLRFGDPDTIPGEVWVQRVAELVTENNIQEKTIYDQQREIKDLQVTLKNQMEIHLDTLEDQLPEEIIRIISANFDKRVEEFVRDAVENAISNLKEPTDDD